MLGRHPFGHGESKRDTFEPWQSLPDRQTEFQNEAGQANNNADSGFWQKVRNAGSFVLQQLCWAPQAVGRCYLGLPVGITVQPQAEVGQDELVANFAAQLEQVTTINELVERMRPPQP